jgi:geranylgeranyl diphosphate synthase type I
MQDFQRIDGMPEFCFSFRVLWWKELDRERCSRLFGTLDRHNHREAGYLYRVELSEHLDLPALRGSINEALSAFIAADNHYLTQIGPELEPVAAALKEFLLQSGKRFRPLFASVGYLGTGSPLSPELFSALSSVELIHVCALIHDDVMDASDTRRGAPAIHKHFENLHQSKKLSGSSAQFGIASAILLGDLALVWASKMLHESKIPAEQIIAALPIFDEMEVELMAGQYLDIYEQALASESVERSLKVARYKSGKYSIERPLHFGAAIANKNPERFYPIYSAYGLPLGEAFQLRDDLLGVFGEPAETGKPAGDDLREGKRTVLMALTHERSNESQRKTIKELLGKPDLSLDEVNELRGIIIDTGARDHLEGLISTLTQEAVSAIDNPLITSHAQSLLHQMATIATQRKI